MFGLKNIEYLLLLLHENREHKSSTEEQNLLRALGLFAFHSASANNSAQEVWGWLPRDPTSTQKPEGYEEEQDLVVLQGAAQPHDGHQEQEHAHADDPRHHPDAGDQAEPFPPRRHAHQQQAHQLRRKETALAREKEEVQPVTSLQEVSTPGTNSWRVDAVHFSHSENCISTTFSWVDASQNGQTHKNKTIKFMTMWHLSCSVTNKHVSCFQAGRLCSTTLHSNVVLSRLTLIRKRCSSYDFGYRTWKYCDFSYISMNCDLTFTLIILTFRLMILNFYLIILNFHLIILTLIFDTFNFSSHNLQFLSKNFDFSSDNFSSHYSRQFNLTFHLIIYNFRPRILTFCLWISPLIIWDNLIWLFISLFWLFVQEFWLIS